MRPDGDADRQVVVAALTNFEVAVLVGKHSARRLTLISLPCKFMGCLRCRALGFWDQSTCGMGRCCAVRHESAVRAGTGLVMLKVARAGLSTNAGVGWRNGARGEARRPLPSKRQPWEMRGCAARGQGGRTARPAALAHFWHTLKCGRGDSNACLYTPIT